MSSSTTRTIPIVSSTIASAAVSTAVATVATTSKDSQRKDVRFNLGTSSEIRKRKSDSDLQQSKSTSAQQMNGEDSSIRPKKNKRCMLRIYFIFFFIF